MLPLADGFKFEKITEIEIIHHISYYRSPGLWLRTALYVCVNVLEENDTSIFGVKGYTRHKDIVSPKRWSTRLHGATAQQSAI